jgi:hypothetical protein
MAPEQERTGNKCAENESFIDEVQLTLIRLPDTPSPTQPTPHIHTVPSEPTTHIDEELGSRATPNVMLFAIAYKLK